MKKTDLINFVNNQLGYTKLKTDNTVYSNINRATPCWWLNISPSKFNSSLNIILIEKDELIKWEMKPYYFVFLLLFLFYECRFISRLHDRDYVNSGVEC